MSKTKADTFAIFYAATKGGIITEYQCDTIIRQLKRVYIAYSNPQRIYTHQKIYTRRGA